MTNRVGKLNHLSVLKMRLFVFLALAACFAAFQSAFSHWGRTWAIALYKPLLEESVNAAIADDNYGLAESVMVRALKTSPEYASSILDFTGSALRVMPLLARELDHVYADGPHENGVMRARVLFASGAHADAIDGFPDSDKTDGGWIITHIKRTNLMKQDRYRDAAALPPDPVNNKLEAPAGLTYSIGQWTTEVNVNAEGFAAVAAGDFESAAPALERATADPETAVSAWINLGILAEAAGDPVNASANYAQAVNQGVSPALAARRLLALNP
ncbi:MAG: hypothetical protein AMXMBFR84_30480 [Candidatus Hydrogenedentota bacterium]